RAHFPATLDTGEAGTSPPARAHRHYSGTATLAPRRRKGRAPGTPPQLLLEHAARLGDPPADEVAERQHDERRDEVPRPERVARGPDDRDRDHDHGVGRELRVP